MIKDSVTIVNGEVLNTQSTIYSKNNGIITIGENTYEFK